MEAEVWADIAGYERLYQVSNFGSVRNRHQKLLKPQRINSGYLVLHLYRDGTRTIQLVHRLVAGAFRPNPHRLPEVNHKNTDKRDNHWANLEWCTRQENVDHAGASGRRILKPCAQAVVGVPVAGGEPVRFVSQKDAEVALTGKQSSAIHHCLIGKKKTAYGYTWSRA